MLIFLLGINCGLRISDILNLNVENVKDKTYIDIIEKKTNKQKRFPINIKLRLLQEFTQNRCAKEPLFLSVFNNRMERTPCYRIINNVCKKEGIEYKVGTHTLRKTFAYHHYQTFKDIVILQKILNHSSPQITLRYIGIDQDIMTIAIQNLFYKADISCFVLNLNTINIVLRSYFTI